jgi:predicted transcriptional regulator
MSSLIGTQSHVDGTTTKYRRAKKQGRKSSGLGKPTLYRLYKETEMKLKELRPKFGYLYNENQIVRDAVKKAVDSIYTELVKS